jgi:radical SAM superfamily enzyme YgiQ (UPF0313 family)
VTWDRVREARQRLAGEQGAIRKDWGGRLPIALIYPNSYYLGMSNLGIHAIYRLLNEQPDIVCERIFWDPPQSPNAPAPVSVESQRPLTDFAALAFSITYELDYLNLAPMLTASGIPINAAERGDDYPLLIAGGATVTANPMPVALFFDALCIGEAEAILPAMLPLLTDKLSGERGGLLKELAQLPGVYVPSCPPDSRVVRQWVRDMDGFPVHSTVLTHDTELGGMYLIEVERGCPWNCRFCLVSGCFRPMRARSLESLVEQAKAGLQHRRRLGLVGPSVPDHPQFEVLLARLKEMGADLAISSLRIKPFHPDILGELARGGTKTVALAPEAGSERLRRVINKGITEDDILTAAQQVAEQGLRQLRLYFMIGLPTETDEDVRAIADLSLKCNALVDQRQTGARISLSVAPFVPKAGTPFQWLAMERLNVLNRRLAYLKNALAPAGIKVAGESPAWSEVQAILARGDERLAPVLASIEEATLPAWRRATRGLDVGRYAHQVFPVGGTLPWSLVDSGTSLEHLRAELGRALRVE